MASISQPPQPTTSTRPIKPIMLEVGEKRFKTYLSTLTQSRTLGSQHSSRWTQDQQEDGGSYFIDVDPDIFEHILRYLRHSILPIFYDNAKGHNHALYAAVPEQARYLGITGKLEAWIAEKQYLDAIRVDRKGSLVDGVTGVDETTLTDVDIEYHPTWTNENVYLCPRRVPEHMGKK